MVYIREAHALDSSWPMGGKGAPLVEDPETEAERQAVAEVCMSKLALEPIPAVVDTLDDAVSAAYEAWPDRLYVIGLDGTVTYKAGPGPFGFLPKDWAAAIVEVLE